MKSKNVTVSFSRDFMIHILNSCDKDVLVLDEICDTSRWSIHHRLIFKHEGKYYRTFYSVGATEYQDEEPWHFEEEVECVQVEPYEKTVVEYREVKSNG